MKSLRDDLLTKNYDPRYCGSRWNGLRRPIYVIEIYPWHPYPWDFKFFLDLSRKYGQNTLIFQGYVYNIATGNVIGKVTREEFLKGKPEHPRWIYMGDNVYLVLEFSASVELLDTLTAWSSGHIAPL